MSSHTHTHSPCQEPPQVKSHGTDLNEETTMTSVTPFDDLFNLINSLLLGEEPSVEDFILLIGTFVAFVAFILWCCFPIVPKEPNNPPAPPGVRYKQQRKSQDSD